jgi:hypothetical protein
MSRFEDVSTSRTSKIAVNDDDTAIGISQLR